MRHINKSLFIVAMLLLCVLSSCSRGGSELKTIISSPDKNITELVSKKYTDSQLLDIIQLKLTMNELNKQYPIECLRKVGVSYRASYLGKDSVAIIYFNDNGKQMFGKLYYLYLTRADYNKLAIGQSIEEVQAIDPHGDYQFLYTGSNNASRASNHYTKDGYLITIEYDESGTIVSITTSLI